MTQGIRIVVEGPIPRTKKTSSRIVRIGGVNKILPSKAYMEWFNSAMRIVPEIQRWAQKEGVELPLKGPVHVEALFYRDALRGDLTGYMQAVADWMQSPVIRIINGRPKLYRDGANIIADDAQIESWDGSRLLKDAARPRIEITVRPFQDHLLMADGLMVHEVRA